VMPDDYIIEAMRTLRDHSSLHFQLNHALQGLISETGEIADTIKKHVIYDQTLDVGNIEEEIGDLMWYIALLCYVNGISLEVAMTRNIDKLRKRYPEKFTPEAAAARADKNA
jgi:NTP pyrophosphatase (non-canonical NTP hydrolase)